MRMSRYSILFIVLIILGLSMCKKDPDISNDTIRTTPFDLYTPWWFSIASISESNPLTEEGVSLGRRLYYDPLLHPYDLHACASCHLQEKSFSISTGGTNVLAHVNLLWSDHFLWNGRVQGSLEDIMRFEVEEFFNTDVSRLQTDSEYPGLFKAAFGSDKITTEQCAMALAQFISTLISSDSKFDRFFSGTGVLTEAEMRGFDIFNSEKGDCFHCHPQALFTDNSFHNIGMDSILDGTNEGRYSHTQIAADWGLFKTPTLRNIALTGPYMHDGRFKTLEEVIDHYDHGVQASNTLDPIMTKAGKESGLNLSIQEKDDLILFLHTLTDTTFTNNPSFRKP